MNTNKNTGETHYACREIVAERDRLRAELAETQRLKDIYWHEREVAVANSVRSGIVMASLRAEVAALREALRLAMVNAYSPEDVIEITEAALAAAAKE